MAKTVCRVGNNELCDWLIQACNVIVYIRTERPKTPWTFNFAMLKLTMSQENDIWYPDLLLLLTCSVSHIFFFSRMFKEWKSLTIGWWQLLQVHLFKLQRKQNWNYHKDKTDMVRTLTSTLQVYKIKKKNCRFTVKVQKVSYCKNAFFQQQNAPTQCNT